MSRPQTAPLKRRPFSWKNLKALWRGRVPGQLIIQYSDRCNARCPQCEMRVQNRYERSTLDVPTVKRAIDAAAEKGIEALSITGGEPFLYREEVLELIRHATAAGIKYVRTGTNGFMLCGADKPHFEDKIKRFAEELAATDIYTFWISIDSADPKTHETMRGLPGVMRGIEKALPILHEHGIYPSANLGINRNAGGDSAELLPDVPESEYDPAEVYDYFRGAFGRFYQRAADLGFTVINMCYPMSVDPSLGDSLSAVYSATASDRIVRFRPDEKKPLFEALYDTVPEHRSKIRIFTPLVSLRTLIKQYGEGERSRYGCRGGVDFFFMDSKTGHAYPCGYRGAEDLGPFSELDLAKLGPSSSCTECDWECFRDPSELTGPMLDFLGAPVRTALGLLGDREFTRLWLSDLRYYKACDYFCGRIPADLAKLARFTVAENARPPRRYTASGKPSDAGEEITVETISTAT